MEPVPPLIMDDGGPCSQPEAEASSPFTLDSTDRPHLQQMEDLHPALEPAAQMSHWVVEEQLVGSYGVQHRRASSGAGTLTRTVSCLQINTTGTRNSFPNPMTPLQDPMWNAAIQNSPLPAIYSFPLPFQIAAPSYNGLLDNIPPTHFACRVPGDLPMINFPQPTPQFWLSSGPCMLVPIPQLWHGAYLTPYRLPSTIEYCPSWCICPPMGTFYQTCRLTQTRDNLLLNGPQASEDQTPREPEEEHQVLTAHRTSGQRNPIEAQRTLEDVFSSDPTKGSRDDWREPNSELDLDLSVGSLPKADDLNCFLPLELYTFDQFTVEDLEVLIQKTIDAVSAQMPADVEGINPCPSLDTLRKDYEPKLQQRNVFSSSPLIEQPSDQCQSFTLVDCLKEDMTFKNEKKVSGDARPRRRKRIPENRSVETTLAPIRRTQREKSQRTREQRNQAIKTEHVDYKEKSAVRTKRCEKTEGQKDKWLQQKRQESRKPKGKPLDFSKRMEKVEWLSCTREERKQEQTGEDSKATRGKTKTRKERAPPAQREIKQSTKREERINMYEDKGQHSILSSPRNRRKTKQKKDEPNQPVDVFKKPKVSRNQPPPAKSKKDPTADKEKAPEKAPKRPSNWKKLRSLKTAEGRCPDQCLLTPELSCRGTVGANTSLPTGKLLANRRNALGMATEPEQLSHQNTESQKQRGKNPKKRKRNINEMVETQQEQRGILLRIKQEGETLRVISPHSEQIN